MRDPGRGIHRRAVDSRLRFLSLAMPKVVTTRLSQKKFWCHPEVRISRRVRLDGVMADSRSGRLRDHWLVAALTSSGCISLRDCKTGGAP